MVSVARHASRAAEVSLPGLEAALDPDVVQPGRALGVSLRDFNHLQPPPFHCHFRSPLPVQGPLSQTTQNFALISALGPPGFHENSKRAHLRVPALQTSPKFNEMTPRETKRGKMGAGGKKKRKILGLPPFGPTLRGPTLRAPPFLGLGPILRAPPHTQIQMGWPKLDWPKLVLAKIGRAKTKMAKNGLAKTGLAKIGPFPRNPPPPSPSSRAAGSAFLALRRRWARMLSIQGGSLGFHWGILTTFEPPPPLTPPPFHCHFHSSPFPGTLPQTAEVSHDSPRTPKNISGPGASITTKIPREDHPEGGRGKTNEMLGGPAEGSRRRGAGSGEVWQRGVLRRRRGGGSGRGAKEKKRFEQNPLWFKPNPLWFEGEGGLTKPPLV